MKEELDGACAEGTVPPPLLIFGYPAVRGGGVGPEGRGEETPQEHFPAQTETPARVPSADVASGRPTGPSSSTEEGTPPLDSVTPALTVRNRGLSVAARFRTEVSRSGTARRGCFGCVVRRKAVPLSVDRNRLKRWLREAFRRNRSSIPPGFDWMAVVYERPTKWSYWDLESQFLELVRCLKERTGSSVG